MKRFVVAFAFFVAMGLGPHSRAADANTSAGAVQRTVEESLSKTLGGDVRFGAFEVDWIRLEARFRDARVEVATPSGERGSARIDSGRLRLSWTAVPGMLAGTVRISEVEVVGPSLRASTAFAREWRPGKGGDGKLEIRLDRLRVMGGVLQWEDAASRTVVQAEDIAGSAAWSSSRKALVGELGARAAVRREGLQEPVPVSVRAAFLLRTGAVEAPTVRLEAPGASVEGRASLNFGRDGVAWSASADVRADAAEVRRWFPAGGPAVSGRIGGTVRAQRRAGAAGAEIVATGRLEAGQIATVGVGHLTLDARFVAGGLEIRNVRGEALGGSFVGRADLTPGPNRELRSAVSIHGADGARLSTALTKPLPLGSTIDAELRVTVPIGGSLASWEGEARVVAQPAEGSNRIPAAGEGRLELRGGRLKAPALGIRAGAASATVDADLPLVEGLPRGRVSFEGTTENAETTRSAVVRIAESLRIAAPDWLRESVRGHGSLGGAFVVDRRGPARRWELRADIEDAGWAEETFDRATVELAQTDRFLEIRRAEVRRGVEGLRGSARFSLAPFTLERLEAEAAGVRSGPILSRWPAFAGIDGYLSADIALERTRTGLEGRGRFGLDGGTIWGEPFERVRGRVLVSEGTWELLEGTLEGPVLSAEVAGSLDPEKEVASGTLLFKNGRPGASARLADAPFRIDGVWSGTGTWGWDRERGARAEVSLTGVDLGIGDVKEPTMLGVADGTLTIGNGSLTLSLDERERSAWRVLASMATADPLPFEATLLLDRFSSTLPRTDGEVSLDLSGSVRARGAMSHPEAVEVDGRFEEVDLYVPGGRFTALEPVPLSIVSRRLRIGPLQLGTKGARLDASVDWNMADGSVLGECSGSADLSLLSLFRKNLRGSGRLDLDVRLAGTLASPELDGRATIADGRIRWVGLRQTLDEVEAKLVFDGRSASLEGFRALSGGGELEGAGVLAFEPGGIARFDVTMGVSQVGVEFPADFRGIYNGALRLEGSLTASTLSGRLALVRGLYDRNFEIAGLGGDSAREVERTVLAELPAGVALDVEIDGSDDIWMRNNMGRIEAGVSLQVRGEIRDPRLSGRIVLYEGGRLRFRDVDYRLLSGSLEFEGSERIDPFVEMRGETRVGDYDVRLRIAGRLDSFAYELSSYPTLAESDIIQLLLTGQAPSASAGTAGSSASSAPGGLAADYFAGVLTGTFSRQVEKAFRLDQFRINPLLESGSDPTARVTLGKQVTDRIRILYSRDLGGTANDRYFLEWGASRRWRLTAEADSDGVYVGTAQFTERYGRETEKEATAGMGRSLESFLLTGFEILGVESEEAARLRRTAELETGSAVRRTEVFLAAEAARRDLAERGWIDARVRVDIAPDSAAPGESGTTPARVEFRVEQGGRTEVVLEGLDGRLRRAARKSLDEFLQEGIAGPDVVDEASAIVLEELQVRGRYAADVVARLEPRGEGERTLRILVDPGPVVRASAVLLDGVSQLPEERVRRQVLTGRSEGLSSRPISPAVLEEDARAIVTLYRSEGFLDATVEQPQVRLGIAGEKGEVRFIVHERGRYAIDRVEVTVDGPVDVETVASWTKLTSGQPVSAAALGEAARNVRSSLDAMGFVDARADVSPSRSDGRVVVRVSVTTGPRMLYAGTVVSGNFRTKEKIVVRESPFTVGEPVSGSEIREFQHRLYRLGIFRSVRITTERADDGGPEACRLRVTVEEAKPVGLNVGFGYNSDAGLQLSFGVGHDNLGGYNRGLSLQTRWSSLERRVQIVGRDPWLFNRHLDTTATYFWEDVEEVGYDLRRNSLAFRVERQLRASWRRFVRYNYQKVDIDILDPSDDVLEAIREQKLQDLRLGDLGLAFGRDSRDDPFLPTAGGYFLGEVRLFAPLFLSQESFAKLYLQGSTTHTFRRGYAYSVAARIGAAKTYGSTEAVPLSERFFAGGSSTLRGFERDSVGLVVDGIPLGGEAMLIINQELRWPLWRSLSLVTFTDWGNVYTELQAFDPTDLRYTAGVGFRLGTPIGPLRIEYGRKLDRREGESAGEFYFAVGTIY